MLKAGILAEPTLVGREQELAELEHHLELVIEGKGTTVFVSGEAGAGKTRLITEFLKRAKQKGVALLSGWCLSDAAVPYFPFVEAFEAYFSPTQEEEFINSQQLGNPAVLARTGPVGVEGLGITAWLAGLRPDEKPGKSGMLSPQVWKDQLFAAVAKTLHLMSTQSPIVLSIEDIHWADSASLALLHYISRIIRSEKILLLATFRSEELTADAEGHPHPLAEAMRLMRREDLITEMKLPNLNRDCVSKIVGNMMGGNVQSELIEKLANESRGNALFLVESLRMLAERKSLVQENNQWRLAVYDLGIPFKVKDIILRRLGTLKNDQRRVLDAASVIGEKFDVELLATVLGQDSLDVLESLNVIARSTSLVCVEGNFYRFDHAKSREALYGEIPLPLRSGYHVRVAERMEIASKSGKLQLSDLAYHYAQAGNKEKAAKYAMAAGQDELARFSNAEARKHFKYVLDNAPETLEHTNERLKALEGLGDALFAMSLLQEAAREFERLFNSAESGVVKLRALRKAMLCSYWRGDPAHSLEIATKANQFAQLDRLEYARLRLYKGFIDSRSLVNDKEAMEEVEGALRVFEEEYSLSDVASALAEMVFTYRREGRLEEEFAAALRSIALYEELEDLRGQLLARSRLNFPFGDAGLYQEALEHCEKGIKIGEKIGDYNLTAILFMHSGFNFEGMGDLKAAVAQTLKGVEYAEKAEAYYALSLDYANLVRYYAMLGEVEHAEEFCSKLDKLMDEVVALKSNRLASGAARISKAFLCSVKGQWKEVNEIQERVLDGAFGGQSPFDEASSRERFAWVLAKQGRIEEAFMQREKAHKIREKSAGKLEHANVQAYLMTRREINVGEELDIRLDLVNIAKNPAFLVRIERLIPFEFKISMLPSYFNLQDGALEIKEMKISPFGVESVNLVLRAANAGVFDLEPRIVYVDELGETKTCAPRAITITVQPAKPKYEVLPGRISTDFAELDALLFGGIPEKYAVALASSSTDERERLIRHFLEAGATAGEITFHITAEAGNTKVLAEKYPSNFYLLVCNPQADAMVENLPNVFKLKGVENLTEIDIALTKAFRTLDPSRTGPKRICIEIVSDALLQHRAVTTRRWLSALLPTLKSKGFTILAVVDPQMHPAEELQAVLGLFEGEINIYEKETPKGAARFLKVKRLTNQKYVKDETLLTEE